MVSICRLDGNSQCGMHGFKHTFSLVDFNPAQSTASTRPHSIYGEVSDILTAVFLLPTVLGLYRIYRTISPLLSLLSTIALISVTLTGIILHALLIFGILSFPDVAYIFFLGLLGLSLWLFIIAYLARKSQKPRHGFVMGLVGATIIGYPVWAIWMGGLLASGKLAE